VNLSEITNLSEEICIPVEVVGEISAVWLSLNMAEIQQYIPLFTSPETEEQAHAAVKALMDGSDPKGFKMLAVQLCAALHTRKLYAEKGINDNIFIETLKSYQRFIGEHFVTYGYYGFDRGWWTYRQLSMRLFRLGVLEFEWRKDKPTISVHIPSDAVMTREALDTSYAWAKAFFAQQGGEYTGMFCSTWLLYPDLKNILPSGSRILNFQQDYEILELQPQAQSIMTQVFKRKYDDLTQLPEDTHLQREIKKLLLQGGNIGNAYGRYKG